MGLMDGDKLTGSVISVSSFGHIVLHTSIRGTSYSGTFIASAETPTSGLPAGVVGTQVKVQVLSTNAFGYEVKLQLAGHKLVGSFVPTEAPIPQSAAVSGTATARATPGLPPPDGKSGSKAGSSHAPGVQSTTTKNTGTTTGVRSSTTGTLSLLGQRLSRTFGRTTPKMDTLRRLVKLAIGGRVEELEQLLQESKDNMKAINQAIHDKDRPKYEDGYTLLHYAAHFDQTAVIGKLVDMGSDVNFQTVGGSPDLDGRTPLFVAARNGSAAAVSVLLDRGAAMTLHRSDSWTIVHAAAGNGRYSCLKVLFDHLTPTDWPHWANMPATQQGKENWYPLLQACGGGHADCARFLLDKGADVNGLRSDGASALHWTTAIGNVDCMKLLLEYGADPLYTFPQEYLFTPLHEAARLGYTDCVKILAARLRPQDLLKQDQNGMTPAQLAQTGGFTAIHEYLERLEGQTGSARPAADSDATGSHAGGTGETTAGSPARERATSGQGPLPVTDTAYSEASHQAAESAPSASSQFYNTQNHLPSGMEMSDGFFDSVRTPQNRDTIPQMDELAFPITNQREVLVVNTNTDPLLRQFINHTKSVIEKLPDDRTKVLVLATLIAERFGGDRPDLVQKCTENIEHLKISLHSNIVPIGQINYGVARHRAVLFKRLGDICGLTSGLGRGECCTSEDIRAEGAWNVVTIHEAGDGPDDVQHKDGEGDTGGDSCTSTDGFVARDYVVDLMDNPGHLYQLSDPAARQYMWQHRGSDNVAARRGDGLGAPSTPRILTLPDLSQPVHLREHLGKGRFSSVSRVSIDGYTCAQKIIHYEHMSASDRRRVEQEVKLLASLRHQNIVRCLGSEQKPGEIAIYMEYVPKTLRRLIQSQMRRRHRDEEPPFSLRDILTVTTGMARGVLYLHNQKPPVIHRDLKSPNILAEVKFDSQGHLQMIEIAKLCDLGIAKVLSATTSAETYTGTIRWMSPEAISLHPLATNSTHTVGTWSDIWSLGMVIYELLTGHLPYEGYSESECISYIRQGTRPAIPTWLSTPRFTGLVKLFEECTQYDPSSRPDALAVVKRLSVITAQV